MINSLSASATAAMPMKQEKALSEAQLGTISETLANFDPDSLSESDAQSIVETFSSAGIQPGRGLAEAMAELGFDAKAIGDLAGVEKQGQRPPPPPPPPPPSEQSSNEISSIVDFLAEALQEKLANSDSEQLTDEDKQALIAELYDKFNLKEGDSLINISV